MVVARKKGGGLADNEAEGVLRHGVGRPHRVIKEVHRATMSSFKTC